MRTIIQSIATAFWQQVPSVTTAFFFIILFCEIKSLSVILKCPNLYCNIQIVDNGCTRDISAVFTRTFSIVSEHHLLYQLFLVNTKILKTTHYISEENCFLLQVFLKHSVLFWPFCDDKKILAKATDISQTCMFHSQQVLTQCKVVGGHQPLGWMCCHEITASR
jgi:hypothetical protein